MQKVATSRKYPGQERTIAWKNTSQTSTSTKVTTLSNSRIGPTKRLRDKSDVPKARLGILPKNIQAQSERQSYILFACRTVDSPRCFSKRAARREFVVDSGARMHMVSEKDLHSSELETMRTSRSPTTVMTANGEVRTNNEATVPLSNKWTCSSLLCFFKKLPQRFHRRETLRRTWVHVPMEMRSKSTSHQKWQEN